MPPVDFIEEEASVAIDFIPDPEPEAPTPTADAQAVPPQTQPVPFDYGMTNAQQRLAELPQSAREQMQTPLVTLPDLVAPDIKVASALGVPGAQAVESVVAAAGRPVKALAESMTSPLGLMMLPTLPVAELAGPLMGVMAGAAIPETVKQTVEGIQEGNIPKAVEGLAGTGINAAMAVGGPLALGRRLPPEPRARAVEFPREAAEDVRSPAAVPAERPSPKIDFVSESSPKPSGPLEIVKTALGAATKADAEAALSRFAATAAGYDPRIGRSDNWSISLRKDQGKKPWEEMSHSERVAEMADYAAGDFKEEFLSVPKENRENYMVDRALDFLDPFSGVYKILLKAEGYEIQGNRIKRPAAARIANAAPNAEAPSGPELIGMGGAVPAEFKPATQTPTGIKNATVERERAVRGLPPAIEPAQRSFGRVWDEAMAIADQDPAVQDKLIADLRAKPRSLTDTEDALLLHRQIDLQNEYGKATRDLAQAFDDGREADVGIQQARVGELSDKLLELYEVGKAAGTETGRGLAARKMMANEDFTLAKMETDLRVAKGGKPLTDTERADLTTRVSEFERINRELEAKVAEKDQLLQQEQMARTMAEMTAAAEREKAALPSHIREIVDKIGKVLDTRADAARKRLQGKLFSISPDVLKDLAEIGASNIYHIGLDLAKWSSKMIADLGERVRPHLNEIWEASKKLLDDVTETAAGKPAKERVSKAVREAETPAMRLERTQRDVAEKLTAEGATPDVGLLAQRLARAFVESGIGERNALIDAVHGVLEPLIPEWTRRQTMDAISGYGQVKLLRKDEISTRLRDLKGQMQQIGKLEDMAEGEAPKKTGLERRTPSEAERELIRMVNQAKREGGYTTRDPATELKSALETVKTRMRNEISDLERRIKSGDFSKKTRREIELDEDALKLEHRRDQLRKEWKTALIEKQMAEQSAPQRTYRLAQEVVNVWRAIRTSLDFSALLNQGKFIVLTHPTRAAKAVPAMFKAFLKPEEAYRVDREILARKNYPLYQQSKLYLAEHGASLNKMEEAYMSRWAEKIPLVAGSARAYTTFLNKLRADSFDAMAATLGRSGALTGEEASVIANYINVATGRGSIGIGERVGTGLNTWFFAPRFVASRFQMALGQPLYHGILSGKASWKGGARARKLVAREYGRLLAGYGILYGLSAMAGFDIEYDPRSTDFLKIKLGDTRIDPLAGLSQVTVLLSRTISGSKKTLKGRVTPLVGEIPRGGEDLTDVWKNFLRTKLAPVWSTAVDFRTGRDVTGKAVSYDPLDIFLNYIGPISMSDIRETMEEQGVPTAIALTLLSMFGERVQTYDNNQRR